MRQRCRDSNASNYDRYGGRGIQICERWNTYLNFYEDMGDRPLHTTLDREDSDGDYTPENCRWAGHHLQAQNKRNSGLVAGVSFRKDRGHWKAIGEEIEGSRVYLGSDEDWFEAVCLRKSWENKQRELNV